MVNFIRLSILLLFRLLCWCLVTSSFESSNLIFGLIVCVLIPFGDFRKLQIKALIPELLLTLRLPFDMLKESIQLILIPHPSDLFVQEEVSSRTRNGSRFAEFLDLFRITFTPMSLVTRRIDIDHWRVHLVGSSQSDHDQNARDTL
jgi:multisubunit Na+/H+ antiporter MnhE subunit